MQLLTPDLLFSECDAAVFEFAAAVFESGALVFECHLRVVDVCLLNVAAFY